MQVIRLVNDDFIFTVECANIDAAFKKAKMRQPDILTDTSYSWNTPEPCITLYDPSAGAEIEITKGAPAHPVFFENKDYILDVEFRIPNVDPRINSRLKEITEKFYYRPGRNVLAGTLNFSNDIGKSDFELSYFKEGKLKKFEFHFEVFPVKMSFKEDYRHIILEIENQYPLLVFDFLKKTYSGFKAGNKRQSDIIWWQIFGGIFEEFLSASTFIINKPNSRLLNEVRYVRAEKIRKTNAALEQEIARNRHLPDKIYRIDQKILSQDTTENRFFKHALFVTSAKFKSIKSHLVKRYKDFISEEFLSQLTSIEKRLIALQNASFFKAISPFTGLRQESLVLEKATGYATVYKNWVMLNRGIDFLEGIQKLELKNIADLYQIWCFLSMKDLLKDLLGKEGPDEIDLAEIRVDDFTFTIKEDRKSRVSFTDSNGERIDLFHEYQYGKELKDSTKTYTVNQRPDIVLRITKNDLKEKYIFTYLFDAKYRLISDDDPAKPDLPPDDAINQMHRYRDAIYYNSKDRNRPEKEIIGGYILFPGIGTEKSVLDSDFYKSIEQINIGAFPFKPAKYNNNHLLKYQLKNLLEQDSENIFKELIPQKEVTYEIVNPIVLIGFVPSEDHAACLKMDEPFYFTGSRKPTRFGFSNLKYFAPYQKEKGIQEYFEILEYEIVTRKSIFKSDHPLFKDDESERLLIRLGKRKFISGNTYFKTIDGSIGQVVPYRYTKLSSIRNPHDGKIDLLRVSAYQPELFI